MTEADRTIGWQAAIPEQVQLVELVRHLMIDYERLHGGPPTIAWLLEQVGLRR